MKIPTMLVVLCICALGAQAQQDTTDLHERLRALERQNHEILQRLKASEEREAQLEARLEGAVEAGFAGGELEQRVGTLVGRIDEGGLGWKHLTKSGNPVQLYGFVRTDANWNSGRLNNNISPSFVLPEDGVNGPDGDDDDFTLDPRLTRIGLDVNAGRVGSADVTAKIETDFANIFSGPAESRATPRIRLAYVDVDWGDVAIRIGQDWDVISPLYPAANNNTLMWNAGNLGDRRAQAQLAWTPATDGDLRFKFELSLGLTGAVDNQDLDGAILGSASERDGFDSGVPHVQTRVGVTFSSWVDDKDVDIGLWGMIASLETDLPVAGDRHFTPWVLGADFEIPLITDLLFRGEIWVGQALSDFRGGIAQSINTGTGEEIAAYGGFLELWWQFCETTRFHVGASMDDADEDDLASGARDLNWTVWVGVKHDWGGGLYSGLDVIYWQTDYVDNDDGDLVRVNAWVQLNF